MNRKSSLCTPRVCRKPSATTFRRLFAKPKRTAKSPSGKYVIHVNTPSYVGTHVTGFAGMTKAMVDYFAQSNGKKIEQINIIPGYVEPSDMEEIKRIAGMMGVEP